MIVSPRFHADITCSEKSRVAVDGTQTTAARTFVECLKEVKRQLA